MSLIEDLLRTGRIADVAILVMLVEGIVLSALSWKSSSALPWGLICNLAAGLFLLLALRAALVGASPLLIPICLTASLFAHVGDMRLRRRSTADVSGGAPP